MIYETLDVIPVGKFINVYLGDYSALVIRGKHSDIELKRKAVNLMYEYSMIVKGKQQMVELYRKDELLSLQAKICLLQSCVNLMAIGDRKDLAIEALGMMGYNVTEDNVEVKVRQVLGKLQFQFDIQQREADDERKNGGDAVDRAYFTKEMAMVMKHNKFTFNVQDVSASMYAYWLKDMIDYFNTLNRHAK